MFDYLKIPLRTGVAALAPALGGIGADAATDGKASVERERFDLTRRFLLLSLAVIVLVSLGSSLVLSRHLMSEGLARDARLSAQFIERSVLQRHAMHYFGAPHEPTAERREVEQFLSDLLWMPDVLRMQVHSDKGRVLWSSHVPATHQTFTGNPELDRALAGELVIEADFLKWAQQAKPEHLFGTRLKTQFVEYYIPVWNADRSKVIGAVEIYKSPAELLSSIREGVRLVWLCDFTAGALMFLALVWVVRRGQRIIAGQQRRLASNEGFVAVGEVASAVAHNLRNPLGAIRTSAELLAIDASAGRPSADLCRYADDIMNDVDRLESWVGSLLLYAHAGSRQPVPSDLNALAATLVDAMRDEAAQRDVGITTHWGSRLPLVRADALLMEQVVRTLVDNALDAMPSGGELQVGTHVDGGRVALVITDSGIGMPPEQVARLFTSPATTKARGLGIGLPLVARTLERMEGRIRVESERGRGTRIEVSLPAVRDGEAA